MILVHASSVALRGRAVLLLGPSGSGKSDLSLRLIDEGAILVSDDQVEIGLTGGIPRARPPAAIRGLIEARGIGLLRLPFLHEARLVLAAALAPGQAIERLPDPAVWRQGDIRLPLVTLDPFEASATAKLRLALTVGPEAIMPPQ